MNKTKLCDLCPGETATITRLNTSGDMRRRLIDLGFADKSTVSCVLKAPLGDPKAFMIKNTVIALRHEDSKNICIEQSSQII